MKKYIVYLLLTILTASFIYELAIPNKEVTAFSPVKQEIKIEDKYFNKYQDKSWISLGDSITRANGYQPQLKEALGFSKVDNMGVNGQVMARQVNNEDNKSTYILGKTIDYKQYDLATIFIGTNDFRYNKKLGHIEKSGSKKFDEDTFTGAYQLLIEHILSSNPSIEVVLVTPLQRTRDGYDIDFKNKVGSQLTDYVNTIKSLGEMYSIPVLDLYSQSGITKETMDTFTRDGLHPNEAGYERISEKMYRFLLSI